MSNSWAQPDPYQAAVAASPTSSLVGSVESWLWLCQLRGTKCVYIYIYIWCKLYIIYNNITVYIILYYSSLNGFLRRDYQKSTSADSVGGPNFKDHILLEETAALQLNHWSHPFLAENATFVTSSQFDMLFDPAVCCSTSPKLFPHFNPEPFDHVIDATQVTRPWKTWSKTLRFLRWSRWGWSSDH